MRSSLPKTVNFYTVIEDVEGLLRYLADERLGDVEIAGLRRLKVTYSKAGALRNRRRHEC